MRRSRACITSRPSPLRSTDFLHRLNDAYGGSVEIEPSDSVRIDRSLDGTAFTRATGLRAPGWADMLSELANDSTPYEDWRQRRV